MLQLTRGTTPTVNIEVEADLTDYTCELSIGKYGKPYFTADNQQMSFSLSDGKSNCAFKLTQQQMLACKTGECLMQMRAVKDDTAIATEVVEIEVLDVIEQSVIDDVYDTNSI